MSHLPSLQLLAAVDVAGGRAVRPAPAGSGAVTTYGEPLEAALRWQRAGAGWVHLVDLDAAFGRGNNRELLATVVGALDVNVQVSGGIADEETLTAALASGCARVNLGAAALRDIDWVRSAVASHGDRIAVGIDVADGTVVPRGGREPVGSLRAVLDGLAATAVPRIVVTDVDRDGSLAGPDLDLLREVCARTGRPVVASGGIASVADITALRRLVPLGVEAAIIGRALYTGALSLSAALRAAGAGSVG